MNKCRNCNSIHTDLKTKVWSNDNFCSSDCLDDFVNFDYVYIKNFGWQNTIYLYSDFKEVNFIEENSDGKIYEGIFSTDKAVLLKDCSFI